MIWQRGLEWFVAQSWLVRSLCVFLPLCVVGVMLFLRSGGSDSLISQPTDPLYRLLPPQSTQVVMLEPARYPALISGYRRDIGTGLDTMLAVSDRFVLGQARDERGMPFGYFVGQIKTGSLEKADLPRDDEFATFVFVQGEEGTWYRGPDPSIFALPLDADHMQDFRGWRLSMTDANLGIWFDFDRSIPVDPSAVSPVISDVSFASVRASGSGDLAMTVRLGRNNPVALPLMRLQPEIARVVGGEETVLSLRIGGVRLGQRLLSVGLSQFIPDMPGLVTEDTRAALLDMIAETLVHPLDFIVSQGTDFPLAIGLRTATPAMTLFLRAHYPVIQNVLAMLYPEYPIVFSTGGLRLDLGEGIVMQGGWRQDGEQSVIWLGGQPFVENQPTLTSPFLHDHQIVGHLNGDALLPFRDLVGFDETVASFLEQKQGLFGIRFDENIMTVDLRLE
ncbi:MAG: hypothetical protein NZL83_04725 [Candidatus Absconditabacterales bacterium]|nr:hypothetical protein [Candidatus Absconditabacterales bacterium]